MADRGAGPSPEPEPSAPGVRALPAAPSARVVVVRAGGERFAVPLEAVREVVVPQPPFARVPRAAPAVRGAMNLRGRVVAVVELAPLLGLSADPLGPAQGYVLILDRDRRGLGLLVASVLGVDVLAAAVREARDPGGLVTGVVEVGGTAVTLLDPSALEARVAALFQSP